jgi:hypothetical protein
VIKVPDMRIVTLSMAVAVLCALPAFAQRYEFGLHGGASLYGKKTVTNARGSADAGFKMGWAGGFTLGHNMYEHVGGEIRYTFLHNDMKLEAGSARAAFASQAHVIHYDLLIHGTDTRSAVRPYVALAAARSSSVGAGPSRSPSR